MQFTEEMITPAREDISDIQRTSYPGGKNIRAQVSYNGAKLLYVYALDAAQSGKEFIYAPDSLLAEIPLYRGKAHGKGKIRQADGQLRAQYFYYGKMFSDVCNDKIVATDGDTYVIKISAAFAGYDEKALMKNKLPNYIFNEKEKQTMRTVIFEPVAQNTIVRPMAQAISLARGGETVPYIDTADKKKKAVGMSDLSLMRLRAKIHGLETPMEANLVAFKARHEGIQVRVLVNDVVVNITAETTLDQAMAQFRKKLARQERIMEARATRQRTA